MRALILSLAIASLLPAAAFAADNTSARRYANSEALSVQNARLAEVLLVREVELTLDKRVNAGSAIGAAVAYGAAREIKGDHRSAARIVAGTIGGVAGTAVQKGISARKGVEIYVRDLESGKVQAIVQSADLLVRAGDKVFLTGRASKTRVVPIQGQR